LISNPPIMRFHARCNTNHGALFPCSSVSFRGEKKASTTARQEPRPPKGTTIILDGRSAAETGTSHICSTRDATPSMVPFFRVLPCSSVVKKASTTARQEPRPPKGATIILDERSMAETGTSHIRSTRDATPSTVQFFRVLPWHSVVKKSKHNGSAGASPSQGYNHHS